MPAELTHKSGFRYRKVVVAFLVTLGSGYLLGMAHAQSIDEREPAPTTQVTPTK